jgi:hypothetical protein
MDLIRIYINRGQFGKFVREFLSAEYDRRKEESDRHDDLKLWIMYVQACVNGATTESYGDWKKRVLKPTDGKKSNRDDDLDEHGIQKIISDLFPS